MMRIPFNRSNIIGKEIKYMQESLQGKISGDGKFTFRCSELLEDALGVNKVLLTTSCTHALEMSSILLDINSVRLILEDPMALSTLIPLPPRLVIVLAKKSQF